MYAILTSHPVLLSLAIPPWIGAMNTDDGYGHCYGRNGEFCVTVDPVTRTAIAYWPSVLRALAVSGADHPTDLGRMLA